MKLAGEDEIFLFRSSSSRPTSSCISSICGSVCLCPDQSFGYSETSLQFVQIYLYFSCRSIHSSFHSICILVSSWFSHLSLLRLNPSTHLHSFESHLQIDSFVRMLSSRISLWSGPSFILRSHLRLSLNLFAGFSVQIRLCSSHWVSVQICLYSSRILISILYPLALLFFSRSLFYLALDIVLLSLFLLFF